VARIGNFGLYEYTNFRMGGRHLAVMENPTVDGTHHTFPDRTTAAKWVQAVFDQRANGGVRVDYKTRDGWPAQFKRWKRVAL